MRIIAMVLFAFAILLGCAKKTPPQEPTLFTSSEFPGSESVMAAARRIFPESGEIDMRNFFMSVDDTHEFVVVFTGREIKGGFERMYWRYLTFVKKKSDRDWSTARVFDVPDNHFGPFRESMAWLEKNAKELQAPNQMPEPTASGRGSS